MKKYILKGKKVVSCDNILDWVRVFEKQDRIVAQDNVVDIKISTVFLGIDHSFGVGPPLIFETMVFGGDLDQEMDRYSTWKEAVNGHKKMVRKVRKNILNART